MPTHSDSAGFTYDPKNDPYAEEAKQRWGDTDAYKQSQERVKKFTKDDWAQVGKEADDMNKKLAALAEANTDPASPEVQEEIAKHYQWLRHFYEPSLEMYRGLGSMYADDPRFAANYDKYRPGLAAYMRDAMHAYCDAEALGK